jgi:EmrB/QacA subfamily drug resistance transporter
LTKNHKIPRDGSAVCSKAAAPWVLAATILGSSITFIDGTVVNVALPAFQQDLNAGVSGLQWIVESYALMLSALILTGGSLGDRWGRRLVFCLGTLVFAIASLACGLSQTIGELIAARAVQGVGAAMLVPGSLAIISASFSDEDRGRAIGTWSGFTAIAAGIGPVLGGWLIEHFSWHWIFFLNIPLCLIVIALAWWHVPESRDERSGRLDVPGAVTATLGLGGIVFGLIEAGNLGFRDPWIISSLAAGAVLLGAFAVIEFKRGQQAMMPLSLFRSSTFLGANLLTLFLYAALSGMMFFLPFNLIQVQGYSPTQAAASLLPFVAMMFVLSKWAGGLIHRYGSKLPLIVGPVITSIGFAMFIFPGAHTSSYWTSFFPAIMVMSLGMAISVAPLSTTVMSAVEQRHAGIASGISNAVARTSGLLAVAILGVVMAGIYSQEFLGRIRAMDLPAETRVSLENQANRLAAVTDNETVPAETKEAIVEAANDSFISGFRIVMLIAAVLGLASAFCAWALIEGKRGKD